VSVGVVSPKNKFNILSLYFTPTGAKLDKHIYHSGSYIRSYGAGTAYTVFPEQCDIPVIEIGQKDRREHCST
jgi:hypothetical protein